MPARVSRHTLWVLPPACLLVLTTCDRTPTEPTPPPTSCHYTIAPAEFTPCMQAPDELSLTVFAVKGCSWTAGASVSWAALTANASGTGTGTPRFRLSDNWDAPREGLIVIHGGSPDQAVTARIAQAGCVYWVSQETIDVGATGGSGGFDVMQQSLPYTCGGPLQNACQWSAGSDVPWIAITSTMPRTGDSPVAFVVSANDGAARSGTITVRDKAVRVVQAGR